MTSDPGGAASARRLELVPGEPADLAAALAAGDRAREDSGDLAAGRRAFERASGLAGQAGDATALARAALGLAGLWVGERRTVAGAAALEARLRDAAVRLDPASVLAQRVRARLDGEADYARGEHAAICAALGQARAAGDPVALAEAVAMAHHCLLGPEHLARRQELAGELVRAAVRTGRRSDLLLGLVLQTADAYAAGDPHAGRYRGELSAQLAERGHLAVGFVASAMDVMLAIRAGRLAQAEALAGVCAERGAAAGDADGEWWPGAQLVTIRWYQGRLAELAPMLAERAHSPALSAVDNSGAAALAVAAALAGDRPTAASSLAALCGRDLAGLPRSSSWLVTMNGAVEAAALLGDADVAARAYELLSPYAALPMIGSLGITCFGVTHQALGLAALTAGQGDRAAGHLRAAVRLNLALGHWPAVVAARQRLARALELRGAPGDAATARRERETARAEAAELGLPVPASGDDGVAARGVAAQGLAAQGLAAQGLAAQCSRAGRGWRVGLGSRSVLVQDSIGLVHLAVLIANPRREIPAAELVAGLAAVAGAGHPVLDQAAIAEYRERVRQLDEELAGRAADADLAAGGQAGRAERDWLVAQLASAAGLGGRTRTFTDAGERARVAAGKAIRRALDRIDAADPVIGAHLRHCVRTGARCSYWPG